MDQLHLQQRAIDALRDLLARISNEDLPVITWAVHSSPDKAALSGFCDAEDSQQRRMDFEVWREALYAERQPMKAEGESGSRLIATVQDNYLDLSIEIIAEI
ncbi:hypothetical protein E1267_39830 [Nonomuraea longispora]|uniref:Uncharacterized protein n=1 Tax=Nonomuraea longispora TaxID=1848320 RepID=A0A4R4MV96_9ACTN|nr:hypothetical protein [Nonomuraea longispora]TDB97421.1 hypothetical protein E1267_39830 [Nonomuraea longispora]